MSREIKSAEVPPEKQGEKIDTVIAHWSLWGPMKSGLYETVKELVMYEMRIPGVMAGIVNVDRPEGGDIDPNEPHIVTQSHHWAYRDANVQMVHYSDTPYSTRLRPQIFMIHGTPEACLYSELSQPQGRSYTSAIRWIQDCEASIVLMKRHYHMWKVYDSENKLHYVPKGIDLERFKPDGQRMDLDGKPAILYGEVWRQIKDPFVLFYAVAEYAKRNPEARLHVFSCSESHRLWHTLLVASRFDRLLGKYELSGTQQFPEHWYRGAHMVVSPVITGEPSRVVKEALACGCPVICWDTDDFDDTFAFKKAKAFSIKDMADKIEETWEEVQANPEGVMWECRKIAEDHYDMKVMAERVVEIVRKVLNKR